MNKEKKIRAMFCPSNCGSAIFSDITAVIPSLTSSPVNFCPFLNAPFLVP